MKSGKTIRLAALLICALAGTCVAQEQSLGEAAREVRAEREQRDRAAKKYTNDSADGRIVPDQEKQPNASADKKPDDAAQTQQQQPSDNSQSAAKPGPAQQPATQSANDAPPAGARRGIFTRGARKAKRKNPSVKSKDQETQNADAAPASSTEEPAETVKTATSPDANPAKPAAKPAQADEKAAAPESKPTEQPAEAKVTPAPTNAKPATANAEVRAGAATATTEVNKSASPVAKSEPESSSRQAKPEGTPANAQAVPAAVPVPEPVQSSDPILFAGQDPDADAKSRKRKKDDDERDPTLPPPLAANGSLTAGFYEADTKNGHTARESSPVASVNLNIDGYFHHPGFLKFNFNPQGSLGRQSSEAIFPDGRGFAASTTFLGGSIAPLTVSYSKIDRKLVTFGPLDRLAGLDANTTQDALNVNWRLRLRRLPELTMNFAQFNNAFEPLQNLAPKTDNHARLFTLAAQEKVAGWNLKSDLRVERANQTLVNLFDPTQAPYDYGRKDREIRLSADRDFGHMFLVSVNGGASKGDSQVNNIPYDQSFKYVNGSGVLRPTQKLSFAFRGGITTNAVGVALANTLNNTTTPGTPAQTTTLVPTSAHLMLQTYGVQTTYSLTNDLRLDGDVSHEATTTPETNTVLSPDSSLNQVQAGIGYSHHFSWVKFQSRYAANAGNFEYGTTGTSRSLGHRANMDFTFGSLRSLELTVTGQGSLQNLNGPTTMHDQTWGGSVSVSRMFLQNWKLQATANIDKNAYRYAEANYNTLGKGGSITLSNPRVDFSAMYQLRDGLTVQADPRLQFLPVGQVIAIQGAFPNVLIVPSASSFTTASLSVHPVSRLTTRITWITTRQAIDSAAHNKYSQWEASAGYHFRSLDFDFGYIHHDQDFGPDFFRRNRIYFRVVRQFKVF